MKNYILMNAFRLIKRYKQLKVTIYIDKKIQHKWNRRKEFILMKVFLLPPFSNIHSYFIYNTGEIFAYA